MYERSEYERSGCERSEQERSGDNLQFKLHNGKAVTISKEYYDDLVSIGLSDHTRWKTNKRVVVVRYNGRNIPLARLIAYTIPRWKIQYHDNNPLNLTHGNLITQYDGRSKHDYRKLVTGSNPLSD